MTPDLPFIVRHRHSWLLQKLQSATYEHATHVPQTLRPHGPARAHPMMMAGSTCTAALASTNGSGFHSAHNWSISCTQSHPGEHQAHLQHTAGSADGSEPPEARTGHGCSSDGNIHSTIWAEDTSLHPAHKLNQELKHYRTIREEFRITV